MNLIPWRRKKEEREEGLLPFSADAVARLAEHGRRPEDMPRVDADAPGDAAATQMIALHPAVQRQRPPAHDWNDAITVSR